MAQRLRAASRQDAIVNAIVLLDVYSSLVPAAIHDILDEIKPAFAALLARPPSTCSERCEIARSVARATRANDSNNR